MDTQIHSASRVSRFFGTIVGIVKQRRDHIFAQSHGFCVPVVMGVRVARTTLKTFWDMHCAYPACWKACIPTVMTAPKPILQAFK